MQELLKIEDFRNYKNPERIFDNLSLCHYGSLELSKQETVAYKREQESPTEIS